MVTVFLRTLLIYLLLLLAMRFLGKRQIGELQLSELVTTLMLSELAVLPISDTDIPLSYAVVPILTLLSLEVMVSFLAARSSAVRRLLYGAPSILVFRGRLNWPELSRLRIGVNELLSELRLKDAPDIASVRWAILEDNGKLSVFRGASSSPLTPQDAGIRVTESGVALPVLVSGRLMKTSMAHAGVDAAWIDARLARHGLRRRDVLLMTVDERQRAAYILSGVPDGRIVEVTEG